MFLVSDEMVCCVMGQTGRRRVDCSRALGRQQQMSDIPSLLRAGVQPTLDPSAETFMSVQCASPRRGGEFVGVCCECAHCVWWRKA